MKTSHCKQTHSAFQPSVCIAVTLFFGAALCPAASYYDHFASIANLSTFGSVNTSVNANTLTATRITGGVDSGFRWNPGGPGNYFSLLEPAQQHIFSLDAMGPVNGGEYNIAVLLWNSSDVFVNEMYIQSDTNAIGTFQYNIADLAASEPTATQWSAQIRIQPYASDNVGFQFQNFAAVPEPTGITFFGVAGFSFLMRRRRSQ